VSDLTAVLDERLAAWRRDTPGCQGRIHLNNAGASFSPLTVVETELAHFRREQEIGGYEAADEAAGRLRELNINTSAATNEDGSPVPVVRVSPHYYNTREEVDTLVDAIEALIQEERR